MGSRTIYVHLLNGKPAIFDGECIVFARHNGPTQNRPAESLRQVRREQSVSRIRDTLRGERDKWGYSYVRYRA